MARITPGLDFIGRRFLAPGTLLVAALCCSGRSSFLGSLCAFASLIAVNVDLLLVYWTNRTSRVASSNRRNWRKYSISPSRLLQEFVSSKDLTDTKIRIELDASNLLSTHASTIIGSFIAFAVLHMRGVAGKAGWRWLFLVEGLITLSIGTATFFKMPPGPTETKTWFRPDGWFTQREEVIAVTRVLRDDPTKGDMHNREGLSLKRLWTAVMDYDLWPLYIAGLMFGIPISPPHTYLTLSLRNLGFDTFQTNLLTIPSSVGSIIMMAAITLVSEIFDERAFVSMAEDLWALPFLMALYNLPDNPNQWRYYGIATGLLSFPYVHPIQVAWCSRNAGGVASRTVNASLYNMFVQLSSVVAAQVYREDDAPQYRRGNRVLIYICCFNLFIMYPGIKAYYVLRNKQKARIWDSMTSEERAEYLKTTSDVGTQRLDFRFAH